MPRFAICALAIWLCACGATPTQAEFSESRYQQLRESGLEIIVDGVLQGSGFIVGEREAATAAHVVLDSDRIEVLTADGNHWPVEILASDLSHDTALLGLRDEEATFNAPALELETELPKLGEELLLYGAPIFRHSCYFTSKVARDDLTFEYLSDLRHYLHVMHLNAISAWGTSGGPWLNARGKVVGLQSGMMQVKGAPAGVFYMAPASALKTLLETEKDACSLDLGLAVIEIWESKNHVERFPVGARGLVISKVQAHSGAEAAGVEVGSLLTHVNGKPVQFRNELFQPLFDGSQPQKVSLTLQNAEGDVKTIDVKTRCLEVRE